MANRQLPPTLQKEWISVDEASRQLGISKSTFYRMNSKDDQIFRCKLLNKRRLVSQKDIDVYLKNLPDA